MASNATITPTKVSNDTTDSSMLPNNQNPQTDNTPTKEIRDKFMEVKLEKYGDFPDDLKSYYTVYDLYITQKLSKKELANKYNCDTDVIDRILKKFNIPIRGCSESKIGVMVGDKHPNWQGGITGLHYRLREAFYVQQVPLVLARDHYCCQLCGSKENLQVHHKKHFTDILHRVLNEHSELDPVKDQNELYDIALKDSEFNDLDNLITYCKECHLFKVHRYKYKEEK